MRFRVKNSYVVIFERNHTQLLWLDKLLLLWSIFFGKYIKNVQIVCHLNILFSSSCSFLTDLLSAFHFGLFVVPEIIDVDLFFGGGGIFFGNDFEAGGVESGLVPGRPKSRWIWMVSSTEDIETASSISSISLLLASSRLSSSTCSGSSSCSSVSTSEQFLIYMV